MADLRAMLADASVIYVVDWPHQDVPAALIRAGYTVAAPIHPPTPGPERYLVHELWDEVPPGRQSFPVTGGGYLGATQVPELPGRVDVVCTFRPSPEQGAIVEQAVQLRAGIFWVEPPAEPSPMARELAEAFGLAFVDGISIARAVELMSPRD